MRNTLIFLVGVAVVSLTGVAAASTPGHDPGRAVRQLKVQVLEERPHAADTWTEGFEISDGVLYEGTMSELRATDPKTGAILKSVDVGPLSTEGITVVGDNVVQLQYVNGKAQVRNKKTLAKVGEFGYSGWGWGLCYDGRQMYRSDAHDLLHIHDPVTFAEKGVLKVNADGVPVSMINELECAQGAIWANIWGSDRIIRIDPRDGHVTAVVDASGLYTPKQPNNDVLNGIAAIPGTDQFLITGKTWPTTYRVRFVPA